MKKHKIPTPIMKIREVIKEIRFDARIGRVPRIVLTRIVSCMETVEDIRIQLFRNIVDTVVYKITSCTACTYCRMIILLGLKYLLF